MSALDRIRVLRVIARMNVGGPAWQASVLTRGLDPERYETRLVVGTTEEDEADFLELRDPDLPVTVVPGLGRSPGPLGDLRALLALVREVRDYRPDVVHTHTAKAGALGRVAALVGRVPIRVHTFHGHVLHGYFGAVGSALVRLVERVLAFVTTAFVVVGERVSGELVEAGIGRMDDHVVIPPGVAEPEPVDQMEARRHLGLPVDRPVVLFVGRLTVIKRVDRLLEAFERVLARAPRAVLAIAGEGDLADDVRRWAAPMGESVRLLGWQAEIATLYAAADLVVISSDNEGMPVTLIEAAMAGVPGVTTDVGSASEVVVHGVTGLVVAADSEALGEALAELVVDEGRRASMGTAAAERARERFGVRRLVRDHEDLYRRLLGA
ncbi:MAG: glycosyltransferase family 1 protein [Acidimicrobiaceae bacterium]|nr:glycosyltransferase family 1 protein [Acidimicrobiaceae bacterium]